jgi:hypothetical protein
MIPHFIPTLIQMLSLANNDLAVSSTTQWQKQF